MQKIKTNEDKKKARRYPSRSAGFFALAILCILYYFGVLTSGGAHTSIIWIWPVGAVFFSLVGVLFYTLGRIPTEHLPCAAALIIIVGMFASFLCFEAAVIIEANKGTPDGLECIVVLGAGVKGERPSRALACRINTAIEYLERNPDTVAVLSGGMGYGESITEAECMRREMTARGIDESRLIIEDESRDTSENVRNTLAIIGDKYNSIGVVTNNFHVYRAIRLMRSSTDVDVYGISAPFPSPLIVHFAVREYVGMCHDTLMGNIK